MSRYFAQIENNTVTRVIVAHNIEWCQSRLGGEWIETRDPHAEVQTDPELEPVNYCGPGYGADPTFPERFAPQWVQPAPDPETGEWLSYPKGRVVAHNGSLWKSTTDGNVWEPGISAWHPFPDIEGVRPLWVQPTGSHDTWGMDVEVEKGGKYYRSTIPNNATIPGDPSSGPPWNYWLEIDVDGNPIQPPPSALPDRWVQGGGSGVAGSYNQDINWGGAAPVMVVHDRPQDGGEDWVFRSKIASNTTEPSRDATFDRWWEPLARTSEWTG